MMVSDLPRLSGAFSRMQLDLNDEETLALLNLLTETIECDRYPFSLRDQPLRGILASSARWHRHRPHPPDRQRPRNGTRADDRAPVGRGVSLLC